MITALNLIATFILIVFFILSIDNFKSHGKKENKSTTKGEVFFLILFLYIVIVIWYF